jgi:hypothetical protein
MIDRRRYYDIDYAKAMFWRNIPRSAFWTLEVAGAPAEQQAE